MGTHLARMEKTRAQPAWVTFGCAPLNVFAIGYNFLVFWEWDFTYPRCVGGRDPAPDEDDGGAWEYQRPQDHYKLPPLEALSVLAETTQSVFRNGGRNGPILRSSHTQI